MPDLPTTTGVLAGPALGAAKFQYHRPRHCQEVDDLLAEHGTDARLLAGGTDLLVQLRAGDVRPTHVIDLVDLEVLAEITVSDSCLQVGATATLSTLREARAVRERFTAISDGARCVGSLQIQNRATVVGNVCNGSPAADTAPALLLYDAVATVRSRRGAREMVLSELWNGPRRTSLAADEWVERLTMTDPGPHGSSYLKLGRSRGVDLALLGIACLDTGSELRLTAAALSPTPCRLRSVEELLNQGGTAGDEELDQALAQDVRPISDLRASARYRAAMARVFCRRARDLAARRRQRTNP